MLVTWVSRKGGRKANEDAVDKMKVNGIFCVAAADGLGGYEGGRIASRLAIKAAFESLRENPEFSQEAVKRCISEANRAITDYANENPEYHNMSSTLVLLLIKGRKAIWGNVGDSRLYLLRNKRIAEVTEDHSLAFRSFVDGEIEYDDIRRSPDQNKLTSALGMGGGQMNISDMTGIDNNSAFLLCTDGWWEYVNEDDIEDAAKNTKSARDWLSLMLEARERNAPENSDNYTAATIVM